MKTKTLKRDKVNVVTLGYITLLVSSIFFGCETIDGHSEKIKGVEKARVFLMDSCNCDFVGYSAENLHANYKKLGFHLIGCERTLLSNENEWVFDSLKAKIPLICEIDILRLTFTNKGKNESAIYYECNKANR